MMGLRKVETKNPVKSKIITNRFTALSCSYVRFDIHLIILSAYFLILIMVDEQYFDSCSDCQGMLQSKLVEV